MRRLIDSEVISDALKVLEVQGNQRYVSSPLALNAVISLVITRTCAALIFRVASGFSSGSGSGSSKRGRESFSRGDIVRRMEEDRERVCLSPYYHYPFRSSPLSDLPSSDWNANGTAQKTSRTNMDTPNPTPRSPFHQHPPEDSILISKPYPLPKSQFEYFAVYPRFTRFRYGEGQVVGKTKNEYEYAPSSSSCSRCSSYCTYGRG
jgi:hypothetical protein